MQYIMEQVCLQNMKQMPNDTELLFFFQNDENIKYKIDYHPSLESLKMLHSRMISLCDECGIILTNVVEEHYQLVYYMKASGNYAAITFSLMGKDLLTMLLHFLISEKLILNCHNS